MNKRKKVYPESRGFGGGNKLFSDRYDAESDDIPFDEPFGVASATDCTGLMPFAPVQTDDITSYRDLYDVPLSPVVADEADPKNS